ncbi:hypothetical protein J2X03_003819 [Microbacterium trichothecenolyticum]|uniref:hypothetical protein n=1 Tax=Microbacterium trichothecenolyticum TaxID=69370 RepID=UPI00285F619E|nr:hypothetical protein [Microbacterium trichothecenolyticum]MDR7113917.1 hypothetical protein [Microbacterium trichothecenolyticum]
MDSQHIEHDIALDHVTTLCIAARREHALAVCDALDEHRLTLTAAELHDLAFGAWREFIDYDQTIPLRDVAAVFLRTALYVPEQIAIDLAAETFDADAETWQRFPDGSGIRWIPADEVLILSYAAGPGHVPTIVDVALFGGRTVGRA